MDALTTRLVLAFAGLTVLLAMAGGIALAFDDRTLPDALIALGSGALGLLSGAALDTRGSRQEVVVRQDPGQPVPVEEVPGDAGRFEVGELALLTLFVLLLLVLVGVIPTLR
jgi:hypothetical protein